jgi:uncharacterized protein DUF955
MSTRSSNLAIVTAQAFLDEFGLDCGGRLPQVAADLGLEIKEVEAATFEGALLRIVGSPLGTIALRRDIAEPGRKRFTLAHEIGHYVLPNQQDAVGPCRVSTIESWSRSLSSLEIDANTFAAEVLLPRTLMSSELKVPPTLDIVRDLARRFGTSLTATAVRVIEMTSHRAALVVSRKGNAEWYRPSPEFSRGIRIGPLDTRTVAYDHFHDGASIETASVPAEAWLYDSNLLPGSHIVEHSLLLRTYGLVLSILEIRERVEVRTDDDEEQDNELDPEEFTLQRKRWPQR